MAVNVNKEITVPVKKEQGISMKDWIKRSEKQIALALPSAITPERFARMAMTAVTMNPDLGLCTPQSFIGAMLTAAQLGLEPNTPLGQAYLIPYNNNRTGQKEAQFQLGYRGMIALANRTGEFKNIGAEVVYRNDKFDYSLGFDIDIKHRPALEDRGEVMGVYGTYELKSGGRGVCFMSKSDIDEHRRKYSKAKFSPWDTAWEGMAKKTVLRQALKYAPLSSEFVRGLTNEEVTLNFKEKADEGKPQIISDENTRYEPENVSDVEVVEVQEEAKK